MKTQMWAGMQTRTDKGATWNALPYALKDYQYCLHFGNSAGSKNASFRASCILGLATKQGKSWDKRLPVIAHLFD